MDGCSYDVDGASGVCTGGFYADAVWRVVHSVGRYGDADLWHTECMVARCVWCDFRFMGAPRVLVTVGIAAMLTRAVAIGHF